MELANRDFIVHQNSILLPVATVNFEIPETCRYQHRPVFAHKRNVSFRSYWFQIRPIYALCIAFLHALRPDPRLALFARLIPLFSFFCLLFLSDSCSSFPRVQLGFFKRTFNDDKTGLGYITWILFSFNDFCIL